MTEELAVQGNFLTDTWLQFAAADTASAVFGCVTITSEYDRLLVSYSNFQTVRVVAAELLCASS